MTSYNFDYKIANYQKSNVSEQKFFRRYPTKMLHRYHRSRGLYGFYPHKRKTQVHLCFTPLGKSLYCNDPFLNLAVPFVTIWITVGAGIRLSAISCVNNPVISRLFGFSQPSDSFLNCASRVRIPAWRAILKMYRTAL